MSGAVVSARVFAASVKTPDHVFGSDFSALKEPWRTLTERLLEWLKNGSESGARAPGPGLLIGFLGSIAREDLPGLGFKDHAEIFEAVQAALTGEPLGSVEEELAQLAEAADGPDDETPSEPGDADPDKAGTDGWPELAPPEPRRPAFPVGALPPVLRAWVGAVATAYQVPADLAAAVALGALSTAVTGRFEVEVRKDWRELVTLYVAVVLPSGERKSPVLAAAARPIMEAEKAAVVAARENVAAGQARYALVEKRLQGAIAEAAKKKEGDRQDAEERARLLSVELDSLPRPELPRLLADDATPEALTSLLARHGRMGVMSAEGGLFGTLGGRYQRGEANLDNVLKAWSGEPIRVDRQGRPPEFVERPALSLCLAVQPQVVEAVNRRPEMRNRGLLPRFVWLVPVTALGRRELEPPDVPEQVEEDYAALVGRLAKWTDRTDKTQEGGGSVSSVGPFEPSVLTLSVDAQAVFRRFRAEIEPRLDPATGDLSVIAEWAAKLAGQVVRIAALLHLAVAGEPGDEIGGEAMAGAVEIGHYLIPHALAAFSLGGRAAGDQARMAAVVCWITRKVIASFSVRDAVRGVTSDLHPDTAAVEGTLALLAERGYVRAIQDPVDSDGGRPGRPPSPSFEVHPALVRDGGAS